MCLACRIFYDGIPSATATAAIAVLANILKRPEIVYLFVIFGNNCP